MAFSSNQICSLFLLLGLVCGFILNLSSGHDGHHSAIHETNVHHHHCNHHGDHLHNHDHHHLSHEERTIGSKKLPEELAEEEDLKLYGFGSHLDHEHHHDDHAASDLSGLGLWINAIGCSLLVSMASLVCLIILPVIFIHGKPSNAVVDSLALFGAGAMLGDAFLHQLPHAFGGEHSHSHDHNEHAHDHVDFGHQHSHSLKDLSVGLSILAGIVLFLLVEKVVRYVDEMSGGANEWSHSHHHHHHNHHQENNKKLKDDNDAHGNAQQQSVDEKNGSITEIPSEGEVLNGVSDECLSGRKRSQPESLRKRNVATGADEDEPNLDAAIGSTKNIKSLNDKEPARSPSNLVFGYLNLFSDGVHNFTDGMALGSAFLLYGSVGGWSRTLFLLAHELPQEKFQILTFALRGCKNAVISVKITCEQVGYSTDLIIRFPTRSKQYFP
ncbi:IAA-alanine resistance protein 1 isoform X2 [Cornus florida]|uniref:IAA-alanine resistance protein 1 isoform X2 n=1 Tax=Cornus florida TaxID=4283 RepID=UPI002896B5FD|nr:IAA-alanine resistance protein 1 isoform X2 [Cornus florida]